MTKTLSFCAAAMFALSATAGAQTSSASPPTIKLGAKAPSAQARRGKVIDVKPDSMAPAAKTGTSGSTVSTAVRTAPAMKPQTDSAPAAAVHAPPVIHKTTPTLATPVTKKKPG